MGIKVNLKNVRIAWFYGFEKAKAKNDGEKDAYRVEILVDKDDHKNIAKLDEAALAVMTEALKSEKAAEKWLKRESGLDGNISKDCAIKDGDERDTEDENYEHKIWIRAKSYKQPRILTSEGEETRDGEEDLEGNDLEGKVPYGGCFANVSIELWGQNNDTGKGLRCNWLGVKFVEDGEAFGGGGSSERANDDDLDDDDEDDTPRRGKSKPKPSRRSRDEEDEDEEAEKPRRRRSRDEDDEDEEEERPRRRRR
jgi:hypothetical protein